MGIPGFPSFNRISQHRSLQKLISRDRSWKLNLAAAHFKSNNPPFAAEAAEVAAAHEDDVCGGGKSQNDLSDMNGNDE